MRVFIDTNVLVSASLNIKSISGMAYTKSLYSPFYPITSNYVLDELKSVYARKFPHKWDELNYFLGTIITNIEIVKVPEEKYDEEQLIRDMKDQPVFRAAKISKADILLSGDKDFTDSVIKNPKIMTPRDFLEFDLEIDAIKRVDAMQKFLSEKETVDDDYAEAVLNSRKNHFQTERDW